MADINSIEDLERWKVPALKQYLQQRGISTAGTKKMLVARAFAAWEWNMPIKLSPCEYSAQKIYDVSQALLMSTGCELPNPSSLSDWVAEDESIQNWPPTMIQDIGIFLERLDPSRDKDSFSKRLLSEYKDQKAFSYFSSNWLFDVHYHPISPQSVYCFMKAKCRPSMRLDDVPHEAWVAVEKSSGEIQSAHCTCFAGHGQTCNHVAALLLKIDFCWQHGYVKKAVTDQPCQWKGKGGSRKVVPQEIKSVKLVKPKAGRVAPATSSHTAEKSNFTPIDMDRGMSFDEFTDRLRQVRPSAVFLGELSEDSRYPLYQQWDNEADKTDLSHLQLQCPASLRDLASSKVSPEDLLNALPTYSDNEVYCMERATCGQNSNPMWKEQRIGRCTASNIKDVYTRAKTVQNSPDVDISRMVNVILGHNSPPSQLPQLKYGRRMEAVAVDKYKSILQKNGHKQIQISECGLFVHPDKIFIGASPDRLVSCCCGNSILEVKCPFSTADKQPSPENTECLVYGEHDIVMLDKKHKYFYQIQAQLGVTGRKTADFFVFSHGGYYMEKVIFEEDMWKDVLEKVTFFWTKFIAPALINDSQVIISQ